MVAAGLLDVRFRPRRPRRAVYHWSRQCAAPDAGIPVRAAGSRARRNVFRALFAALPGAEFLRDSGAGIARWSSAPGPCFRSRSRRSARVGKPHRAPQTGAEGPTAYGPPHPARETPATGGRLAAAFLIGHL